jgi:chromosome segregation ATPase
MSHSKLQIPGPLLDDKENTFIAEMRKQITEIQEENYNRIEEILAKHREETRTTAEERDAKHKEEIKEIQAKHKEKIQKLNAKHDAAFAAAITQLQEHQNEIRKIQSEYAKLATELREERARNQQLASMPISQVLQERFQGEASFFEMAKASIHTTYHD